MAATTLLSCVVTTANWIRLWKPIWIPYGDNFQKAYVEEWDQEAHDQAQHGGVRLLQTKVAQMALIWVGRRKVVRQKVRTTKLDSRSTKASGNSRREREVQHCSRSLVSSDSMFSLAAVVFFNRNGHICTTSQLLK